MEHKSTGCKSTSLSFGVKAVKTCRIHMTVRGRNLAQHQNLLKPKCSVMEKTLNEVTKETTVKVIHHVDRVNLYDFGYEKSGSVKGDPDLYASYLNRIINGD